MRRQPTPRRRGTVSIRVALILAAAACAQPIRWVPPDPEHEKAALEAGRAGDAQALPKLTAWLADPAVADMAAWSLGRVEGGQEPLIRCLADGCPAAPEAARALAGAPGDKAAAVTALVAALEGPAAREAAFALGVLARDKAVRFPPNAWPALADVLQRSEAASPTNPEWRVPLNDGAAYALSRMPRGEGVRGALEQALRATGPWRRSLAARAWGAQGLPAADLLAAGAFRDEWRVRVEAARALALAAGGKQVLGAAFAGQDNPHVIVALAESAAALGELAPEPSLYRDETSRCAVAQARDRVRKRLVETPGCGAAGWRSRARAGALAAELGLPEARAAFADEDGRVRGAAAGAGGAPFAAELRALLADSDGFVVQEAAGALAKLDPNPATREAALAAAHRLARARARAAGNAESDALTALVGLTGPLPELLPTPNVPLAVALGQRGLRPPVPEEVAGAPRFHVLRLRTSRGELMVDLLPDVAPLTTSALGALAKRGFYDGLTFHRVVPDFVVQGGDPRGDGDGGPGWALPDEHSPLRFRRGTLGIATSGPHTGGSQFFLCHSPQPHLDGRYTVAGQLRGGDDVLDSLQPGDTILSASAE
jgi:cyclophilin family peptidyl-prolyl cis-trans isomerase